MSKKYVLGISEADRKIFNVLQSGEKTVETRAGGPKYDAIQAGDVLIFQCGDNTFERGVASVEHFKDIEALLAKYAPQEINPMLSTPEEIYEMYEGFPGYKERIAEHGLIAFELE